MKDLLVIKQLKKQFGQRKIINDLSLQVLEGSIFAFLGPNGAGKSTTMNILSTLLEQSSGEIILDGHILSNQSNISKKTIGYVFQDSTLDEELTVYENLYLRGSLYGLKKKELVNNIQHIADEFQMNLFLKQKYKNCSGGQRRLVMIAKSLLHSPKLLILDEPTVGLDPQIRKLVWDRLLKLNCQDRLTIFFSTHYMEEAILASHICIINHGQIVVNQKKKEFLRQYDHKKLMVKERDKEFIVDLNDAKEALLVLGEIDKDKLVTFHFDNYSLDDVFVRLMEVSKNDSFNEKTF